MTPVIFLHVPKTGGTTFRAVLKRVYPSFGACTDSRVAAIREHLARHHAIEILGAEASGGGTLFANQELVREEHWDVLRDAEVFIMFRDPVDFVVSLYRHITRHRDTRRVQEAYAASPSSLASSLETFVADPNHANVQLSFLVGNLPFHTGRVTERSDLDRGLRLLDDLGFHVGVTERYGDFLHVFETVTGKRIPDRTVDVLNVDSGTVPIHDPELRRRIAAANPLDVELYAHARAVAARQAQACGPAPTYRFVEP